MEADKGVSLMESAFLVNRFPEKFLFFIDLHSSQKNISLVYENRELILPVFNRFQFVVASKLKALFFINKDFLGG